MKRKCIFDLTYFYNLILSTEVFYSTSFLIDIIKINLVNYYNRNEKHEKKSETKIGKVISDVLPLF